jgi:hypothetical protein
MGKWISGWSEDCLLLLIDKLFMIGRGVAALGKMYWNFSEDELLFFDRWIAAFGKMTCCFWEDELLLLGRWMAALGKTDYTSGGKKICWVVSWIFVHGKMWTELVMIGWYLADNGWYVADCGWDLAELWKRSSRAVRASDCRNCPGFDPSILRHSEIWGAAEMKQCWIKYI